MPENARPPEDPSFEEAMDALESIVASLETERLPLEEMVTAYERGVRLLRTCRDRIEKARQRVELITADLEGAGKAGLTEFTPPDSADAPAGEPAKKAKRRPAAPQTPADEGGTGDVRLL